MLSMFSPGAQRNVTSGFEQVGVLATKAHRAHCGPQLYSAVLIVTEEFPAELIHITRLGAGDQFLRDLLPVFEIYWITIVRIHQAKLPEFVPLIHIGYAWRSDLEHDLGQRVKR